MSERQGFIDDLFAMALARKPSDRELGRWHRFFDEGRSEAEMLRIIMHSEEYAKKRGVVAAFPPGHYYSPVVDPNSVAGYVARQRKTRPEDLVGIPLSGAGMLDFWTRNLAGIQSTDFPERADPVTRFHYNNGSFPFGDAIMLRAMLLNHKPRRIVEIGSGYTTVCMLDTLDDAGLTGTTITCVEPYADRLRSLLRAEDWRRVTLIEDAVQQIDPSLVATLCEGDLLFIDSTHVVKTGSDVHFELFHLLPRLKPGVIIHFHDIPYPFEYPDEWIFGANHSWNEAYMLQAFLMYNDRFRIIMWNSLFARLFRDVVSKDFPLFLANSGSSIWLQALPAEGG